MIVPDENEPRCASSAATGDRRSDQPSDPLTMQFLGVKSRRPPAKDLTRWIDNSAGQTQTTSSDTAAVDFEPIRGAPNAEESGMGPIAIPPTLPIGVDYARLTSCTRTTPICFELKSDVYGPGARRRHDLLPLTIDLARPTEAALDLRENAVRPVAESARTDLVFLAACTTVTALLGSATWALLHLMG